MRWEKSLSRRLKAYFEYASQLFARRQFSFQLERVVALIDSKQ